MSLYLKLKCLSVCPQWHERNYCAVKHFPWQPATFSGNRIPRNIRDTKWWQLCGSVLWGGGCWLNRGFFTSRSPFDDRLSESISGWHLARQELFEGSLVTCFRIGSFHWASTHRILVMFLNPLSLSFIIWACTITSLLKVSSSTSSLGSSDSVLNLLLFGMFHYLFDTFGIMSLGDMTSATLSHPLRYTMDMLYDARVATHQALSASRF